MKYILWWWDVNRLLVAGVLLLPSNAYAYIAFEAPRAVNSDAPLDAGNDRNPQMFRGTNGYRMCVWETRNTLDGELGDFWRLVYAESRDHGQTWTVPKPVYDRSGDESGDDSGMQFFGGTVLVWQSTHSFGGIMGSDSDIFFVERDHGSPTGWSEPIAINDDAAEDDKEDISPQVDFYSSVPKAVWASSPSPESGKVERYHIRIAAFDYLRERWTASKPIHSRYKDVMGDEKNPFVHNDGNGNCYVVWVSNDTQNGSLIEENRIWLSYSNDGGENWSVPQIISGRLNHGIGEDRHPKLMRDRQSKVLLYWESTRSFGLGLSDDWDIVSAWSSDGGATWSTPGPLNEPEAAGSGDQSEAHVIRDGPYRYIAAWKSTETATVGEESEFHIRFSFSEDYGESWSPPENIQSTGEHLGGPQLYTDGFGRVQVLWYSGDTLGDQIGTDQDVLIADAVFVDQERPTVVVSTSAPNPGDASVWPIDITFSEPVTGFGPGDIPLAPFLIRNFEGSGANYSFELKSYSFNPNSVYIPGFSAQSASGAYNRPSNRLYLYRIRDEGTRHIELTVLTRSPTHEKTYFIEGQIIPPFTNNGPRPLELPFIVENGSVEIEENDLWRYSVGPFWGTLTVDDPGMLRAYVPADVLEGGNEQSNVIEIEYKPSLSDPPQWDGYRRVGSDYIGLNRRVKPSIKIATDHAGKWMAVRVNEGVSSPSVPTENGILLSSSLDDGNTWSELEWLIASSDSGEYHVNPEIVYGGEDTWLIIWEHSFFDAVEGRWSRNLMCVRSADNGLNWSEPEVLAEYNVSHLTVEAEFSIDYGGSGRWMVVHRLESEHEDGSFLAHRISTDNGLSWTQSQIIEVESIPLQWGSRRTLSLRSDHSGRWLLVWENNDPRFTDLPSFQTVLSSVLLDEGGVSVQSLGKSSHFWTTSFDKAVDLEYGGNNTWMIAWQAGRNYGYSSSQNALYVMVTHDGGRDWSLPVRVAQEDWFPFYMDRYKTPSLLFSDNQWILSWFSATEHSQYGPLDAISSATSSDNGATWSEPTVLEVEVFTFYGYHRSMDMAASENGQILFGWAGSGVVLPDESLEPGGMFFTGWPGLADRVPTVELVSDAPEPITEPEFVVEIMFSEAVSGLEAEEIVVTNGEVLELTGSGAVYEATILANAEGAVSVQVPAEVARGGTFAWNSASNVLTRNYAIPDYPRIVNVSPSVSGVVNVEEFAFVVQFNRDVMGFDREECIQIIHHGTSHEGIRFLGGPRNYFVMLDGLAGQGEISLEVLGHSGIVDSEGLPVVESRTGAPARLDRVAPTATLSAPSPYFNGPIQLSLAFDEGVTRLPGLAQWSLEGVSWIEVAGSGAAHNVWVTPAQEGPFSVQLRGNTFVDAAENGNGPSNRFEGVFDATPPEVLGMAAFPVLVRPGERVRLSYQVSEPIAGAPLMMLDGSPVSLPANKGLTTAHIDWVVDPLAPAGEVHVQLMVTDLAGNLGYYENPGLFTVVDGATPLSMGYWWNLLLAVVLGGLLGSLVWRRGRYSANSTSKPAPRWMP